MNSPCNCAGLSVYQLVVKIFLAVLFFERGGGCTTGSFLGPLSLRCKGRGENGGDRMALVEGRGREGSWVEVR